MRETWVVINALMITAAVVASGGASGPAAADPPVGVEAGQVWMPTGVDATLASGPPSGVVRVLIVARRQPVLRVASRSAFRRALEVEVPDRVRSAARGSTTRITRVEKRFARRAREARLEAIRSLRRPARRAVRRLGPLRRAVRIAGGRIVGTGSIVAGVTARVPRSVLGRLAARPDVQAILPEPRERPQLDIAAQVIGADRWWAVGHTGGKGAKDTVDAGGLPAGAAVLLEAPDPDHPAFSDVTIDSPDDPEVTDHGTRTAGIIASQHSQYQGIAHGVDRLIGAGYAGGSTWHESVAYAVGVPSARGPGTATPVRVLSQSFGPGMTHDNVNVTHDIVISSLGLGLAAAAGSGSGDGVANGYENGLVVGAIDDSNTVELDDDERACFDPPTCSVRSLPGPTPAGRKKPDLVAPGQDIVSPAPGGGYEAVSGTSFSTPMVGGALAILHGAGISNPRGVRALLINSARDWHDPPQEHWMRGFGWGVLDLDRALAERANWLAGTVEGGGARFYSATVPVGAKATLAWERRGVLTSWPDPVGGVVFPRANLDLHQYRASDLTEVPPPPDPGQGAGPDARSDNDTIEQVRAPAAGEVIYKVKAASEVAECLVEHPPCDGDESEPFALAAAAPLRELEPPSARPVDVTVNAQGPMSCAPGPGDVEVTARARNYSGDLEARDPSLTLELPEGAELVAGEPTQSASAGALEPGGTSAKRSWVVRATTSGTKRIVVRGSAGTMGEAFTSAEEASFEANCAAPGVVPVDVSVLPSGEPECGTSVRIAARLRNPAALDAREARVGLALPGGIALVGGAASQQVAGGVLAAGATSAEHSWVVRQDEPGRAVASIVGEGVTLDEAHQHVRRVGIRCKAGDPEPRPPGVRLPSRLDPDWLRLRRGRIVVGGRVLAEGAPRGRVRIVARLPRRPWRRKIVRRSSRTRLGAAGRFRVRIRICRAGRWKVRARYLGSSAHRPSGARLGPVLIRRHRLRC